MGILRDATIQSEHVPPSVEEAINSATSSSGMRLAMLAAMESAGMILPRSRDEELNIRYTGSVVPPVSRLSDGPAPEPTCYRVVYPSGNNRFEIYGTSESQLDVQEKQIRQMFGGQR